MIRPGLAATVFLLLVGCSSMERLVDVPTKSSSTRVEAYELETHKRSVHLFEPVSVDQIAERMRLQTRLENLLVLVDDPSAESLYRGIPKDIYLYEIFRRFNLTMPHIPLTGGVFRLEKGTVSLVAKPYLPLHIQHDLDNRVPLEMVGSSDLAAGIDSMTELASTLKGRVGLLIITDWGNLGDDELEAVARFRQRGASRVGFNVLPDPAPWAGSENPFCVFAIGVGNSLSRTKFDQVDSCGFSAAADKIAQPRDMAYFVQKMFYTTPLDSDEDGIYDYKDQCPNTPKDRLIDENGCLRFSNGGRD